jgi:excisionase family DNA binding protein
MNQRISSEDAEEKDLITRAQAAELTGLDARSVDAWANAGKITRYKVGGMQWVRFDRAEVLAMRAPVPTDPFAE